MTFEKDGQELEKEVIVINNFIRLRVNQELIGAVRSSLQKEMIRNLEMKRIDSMNENSHTVSIRGKVDVNL